MPHIVSDRLALEQIFSNLIDNALKYLKPGVPATISIGPAKLGLRFRGRRTTPRHRSKDHHAIFDLSAAPGLRTSLTGIGCPRPRVGAAIRRDHVGSRRNFSAAAPLR